MLESYDKSCIFQNILELMDITRDDLPLVFDIMDVNQSGDVSYTEFVEQLHKMKNWNAHTILVFVKHNTMRMRQSLETQVARLLEIVEEQGRMLRDIKDTEARVMGHLSETSYAAVPCDSGRLQETRNFQST